MPKIEDVLEKATYKQGGLDVSTRVFYTLIAEPGNPHREKLNTSPQQQGDRFAFPKAL